MSIGAVLQSQARRPSDAREAPVRREPDGALPPAPALETQRGPVGGLGLGTSGIEALEGRGRPEAPAFEEVFDGPVEPHRVWAEVVDGHLVVMVASDPVAVTTLLRRWSKKAAACPDPALRTNILDWIAKAWKKVDLLLTVAEDPDLASRTARTKAVGHELTAFLSKLCWAFDLDLPDLGATAVYRGLHFTTDWQAKRGRTVDQERGRTLEEVQAEGAYSQATWQVATVCATKYNGGRPPTKKQLEAANEVVLRVMETWRETTDDTRVDDSAVGKKRRADKAQARALLERLDRPPAPSGGAARPAVDTGPLRQKTEADLERQKTGFTQSGRSLPNQYMAALSRYIDSQAFFERELQGKELRQTFAEEVQPDLSTKVVATDEVVDAETAYKDLPFTSIPFLSTSKDAGEAVKYAQGKLAKDTKSTVGVVGRVLVYVAPHTEILKAGGIDVWEELQRGRLSFTTYRKGENEVTFSGKIPDQFLRAMTPVTAEDDVETNARLAEVAAFKAGAPYGGLRPLPKNVD